MKAETDVLFFLRPFCKFNPVHWGHVSLAAHPAELHCDTSLRALAKKRWFACAKLSKKNGIPSWARFSTVYWMVSEQCSIMCVIRAWYTEFLSRWPNFTICAKKLDWVMWQQPSVKALNWEHSKTPSHTRAWRETESVQRPTVIAHTCFHEATSRGGRW